MAIGEIPPWLHVSPSNFLDAAKAGTALGIQIAEAQNKGDAVSAELAMRAAERQAKDEDERLAREARRWEFEQTMQQRAAELATTSGHAAAELAEATRYHNLTNTYEQAKLEQQGAYETANLKRAEAANLATANHYAAIEAAAKARNQNAQAGIVTHPELPGWTFLRNPSGAESVLGRPAKDMTMAQLMTLRANAYRLMRRTSDELPNDTNYLARAAEGQRMLTALKAIEEGQKTGTNAPTGRVFNPMTGRSIANGSIHHLLPGGPMAVAGAAGAAGVTGPPALASTPIGMDPGWPDEDEDIYGGGTAYEPLPDSVLTEDKARVFWEAAKRENPNAGRDELIKAAQDKASAAGYLTQ